MSSYPEFMIRIKLPNPGSYSCSPSGDTEYDDAYKKAIFDVKPPGFEIRWPRFNEKWPEDKQGYTWVPLYIIDEKLALDYYIKLSEKLEKKLEQIKGVISYGL